MNTPSGDGGPPAEAGKVVRLPARTDRAGRILPAAIPFQPDADELEFRPVPWYASGVVYMLAALIAMFVVWAALSPIDMIVVGKGRFITTAPTIVVQALDTSVIRSIEVEVGQIVEAGQSLVTLDPTFTESDVAQLRAKVDNLTSQVRRLTAETEGKPWVIDEAAAISYELRQFALYRARKAEFDSTLKAYSENIGKLRAGMERRETDVRVLTEHLGVVTEMQTMRKDLATSGSGSRLELLRAMDTAIRVERERERTTHEIAELKAELAQVEAQREAYRNQWLREASQSLADVQQDREMAIEQMQKAQRLNALVTLTAPQRAVVLDVAKRSRASVAREAEPLMTLVPLDSEIEVELMISAADVGFPKVGDPVAVKIDAFPFQKHGKLRGQLRVLSEDSFVPEGEKEGKAFYKARVALLTTRLDLVPPSFRLLPGMTVIGEVKVGERSVLSYLLYPILQAFDEGLRQP